MDALGVPPDFGNRPRLTTPTDVLPACNDILTAWDILCGLVLGYASLFLYRHAMAPTLAIDNVNTPLWREVILGSMLAGALLRERRLAVGQNFISPRKLLVRLVCRAAAVCLALLLVGVATRGIGDVARLWVAVWCTLLFLCACASRAAMVAYLHDLSARGALREAVAVIGAPDVAGRLAARLAEQVAVVRVFDDVDDSGPDTGHSDSMAELLALARSGAVDTVIVAVNPAAAAGAAPIVRHLQSVPVQVTVCSDIGRPEIRPSSLRFVGSVAMNVVAERPLGRWDLLTKSAMDRVGASLALTVASPLLLCIALAVACDSPGPVIYRQRRSGWGGRVFTIYKFRTMHHDAAPASLHQTLRNDPRCTRVGAMLRRTSLDELPQLWNVLIGDMSLVGPRPHADMLHERERAGCALIAEYAQRQRVKPGLTGWAQINGSRGAVRTAEALRRRIALDLQYIDNWSIWLDLQILARTPLILLRGENAY